ncbi:MAG: histidine kinase [Verrucomicrobia bacterium]|nr:histidine kinase [Verrucomicrobiota bacterium]
MAKSFFGRLFSDNHATVVDASAPHNVTVLKRVPNRAVPRPAATDTKIDEPEAALRQILKMHLLAAVAPQQPVALIRARILNNLKELHQIPALSMLAQGFSRTMSRPDVTVEEVVASVAKDQALSVRILRMANSVEVSSEQRIDNLGVAVQMLGVERVRKAADAVFILNNASSTSSGLDWRHLWVHALGTAAIAEKLEKLVRNQDGSVVYLTGLLHDVGKIVLSTLVPDDYKAVLVESWKENNLLENVERLRLGVDHSEAGVAFGEQNKLGDSIIQVIKHHADPQLAVNHRFEVAVVSIANYLAKAYGFGFSGSLIQEGGTSFEELPGWDIIAEETGTRPYFVDIEEPMQAFAQKLRGELAALREG